MVIFYYYEILLLDFILLKVTGKFEFKKKILNI